MERQSSSCRQGLPIYRNQIMWYFYLSALLGVS